MMKKILVIEDEPQTRHLSRMEAEGFDTICAENGRGASNEHSNSCLIW